MRVVGQNDVLRYMEQLRARDRRSVRPPPAPGVGYSQGDPNAFPADFTYSERLVFGAHPVSLKKAGLSATIALNNTIAQSAPAPAPSTQVGSAPGPDPFSLTPFTVNTTPIIILQANPRRSCLIVQNLDGADDLFFNLGALASSITGIKLPAGGGIIFDYKVPSNWVSVVFSASTARGVVVEAAH